MNMFFWFWFFEVLNGGSPALDCTLKLFKIHSGCLDPKKILSTIDPPPGVPGVSKNHIFFFHK